MNPAKPRGFSREALKYLAVLFMTGNHIAAVFLPWQTVTAQILTDLGYFTAITMCFFLTEGYRYTSSRKRYALRLALFALISEVPFCLMLTRHGVIRYTGLNMMFSLLLCFLVCEAVTRISDPLRQGAAVLALTGLSLLTDWAVMAPLFTFFFLQEARRRDGSTDRAYGRCLILFAVYEVLQMGNVFTPLTGCSSGRKIFLTAVYTAGACAGPALSWLLVTRMYSGKRAAGHRRFHKWFFYIYYPAHMLVIGLIRCSRPG